MAIGWQLTPYAIPALLATLAALVMLFLTWRRRSAPGAQAFALLVAATGIWSGFEAVILCAPDLATKLLLTKFEYVGIVIAPTAWLLFALRYCGQDRWLRGWRGPALAVVPAVTSGSRGDARSASVDLRKSAPGRTQFDVRPGRRLRDMVRGLFDLQLPSHHGGDLRLSLDPRRGGAGLSRTDGRGRHRADPYPRWKRRLPFQAGRNAADRSHPDRLHPRHGPHGVRPLPAGTSSSSCRWRATQ